MEDVSCPIAIGIWVRCLVNWLSLPSVGCSGGIITIWDPQTFELLDSSLGSFLCVVRFKSLQDNLIRVIIGAHGPKDDSVCSTFFEELGTFMSCWDVPWCLAGDFNVRFPYKRSNERRLFHCHDRLYEFYQLL